MKQQNGDAMSTGDCVENTLLGMFSLTNVHGYYGLLIGLLGYYVLVWAATAIAYVTSKLISERTNYENKEII